MIDFGTVRPGTTLYIPFATYDSNDPSASVTLTGLATTDIEVYKNGSVTQRSSDSGYSLLDTDGIDFDTITGIHGFSIDLADNTDAGFYAAGAQYTVVVSSITVDAATINFIAATFRIGVENALFNTTIATLASQTSFTLTVGPAEDDALNGCVVWISDVASAVQSGWAVVSDYTGSTKTVTLAAATTFTAAATDNIAIFPPAQVASWGSVPLATTDNLAKVYSDTTIIASDVVLVYSDTTVIASDVAISSSKAVQIYSDTAIIYSDTTAIHSDTTIIASDVVIIGSDLLQVYSDTTIIASDMVVITSDIFDIRSDTTVIESTANNIYNYNLIIYSDTTIIASDLVLVYSDTTAIESGIAPIVSGTADSGTTTTMVDAARTEADTDYWRGKIIKFTSGTINGQCRLITGFTPATDTITFTPATTQAVSTNTYEILPFAGVADVYSDTTTIASDLVLVYSDTTAIHSDTTIVASDVVQIYSDTTITSSKAVQIYSDTTIIYSDTTAIHSDTTIVASDVVIIGSDVVQIYSDTTIIASDVAAMWTTALTEAYRSTGAAGTAAQLLYEILAHLGEFAISGTTKTTKKLDGTTTAKTYTLDSSSAPTSITEAT